MASRLVNYESSENGAEQLPEPSPPGEPCEPHTQIPAPSTDQTFETRDAAIKFLNSFTKTYGYASVTKRSKTPKEGGSIRRVYLQCSRGEVYHPRHDHYSAAGLTLASLRHEEIESKETQVKSYLDSYMSTNQILPILYKDNPESIIKPRDIYNKKRKLRDDFPDGKTPVQALISVVPLPDNGDGIINYETTDTNTLLAVSLT
ncbi:hypothetical protein TSTA_047600 [Talaromyces stipitatus ATCC 10500]|uniref:Uncharacterized protein n=1 Tax=Talaromyces stipitatus (strain ATCC 10500 / CBS 375.48 / QM 6759 / NRRL 1006) TaxID=441959 RepID=B8MKF9_TALSN|nr:uncharacterized protein TSTA_047600 [Talaromyces stipitatus ATCC 10500]EED15314.1 hypothetical protein TSTA_047600 [Talaromyces stipitatus ATCC 10500]